MPALLGITCEVGQLDNQSSTYLGVPLPQISQAYPGNSAGSWAAQMWSTYFIDGISGCDKCILTVPLLFGSGWNQGNGHTVTSPQSPTDATGKGNAPTVMTLAAVAAGTWDLGFTKMFENNAAVRDDIIWRLGWEFWVPTYAWSGAAQGAAAALAVAHLVNLGRSISSSFQFDWNGAKVSGGYNPTTHFPAPTVPFEFIGCDHYDNGGPPYGTAGWNGTGPNSGAGPGGALAMGYAFAAAQGAQFTLCEIGEGSVGADPSWFSTGFGWITSAPNIGYALYYDKGNPSPFADFPADASVLGPIIGGQATAASGAVAGSFSASAAMTQVLSFTGALSGGFAGAMPPTASLAGSFSAAAAMTQSGTAAVGAATGEFTGSADMTQTGVAFTGALAGSFTASLGPKAEIGGSVFGGGFPSGYL